MSFLRNIKNAHPSWKPFLNAEFQKEYFIRLENKILNSSNFFPPAELIYQSFSYSSPDNTKVLILGQDPYPGKNQANGLSFSVNKNQKIPPSLRNIFTELHTDLNVIPPIHGELEHWAKQGVLLLNASLTVDAGNAGSHLKYGWETFTDHTIQYVNQNSKACVFILWGKFAQKKESLIDNNKHLILKSSHPSPLGAYRSFFGSAPFSKTNHFLKENSLSEIDWNLY